MRPPAAAWAVLLLAVACGGGSASDPVAVEPLVRRTAVWLEGVSLEMDEAAPLAEAGIDVFVVRRGSVALTTGVPVVRLGPPPSLPPELPVGVVLRVAGADQEADEAMAGSMWRALEPELGVGNLAELILDLPAPGGFDRFVTGLRREAGVPVVPLLTVPQLADPAARRLAEVAGTVIIPVAGAVGLLRDRAVAQTLPLDEQLAPLRGSGVRVRVAVILEPLSNPGLDGWGDGLDALCEGGRAEITTSTSLDRTFVVRQALRWSGREWQPGDRIALQWMDPSRLHTVLREASHLTLPELEGWDLVFLPPPAPALGIDREALLGYLRGLGPEPRVEVDVGRRGARVEVSMRNLTAFSSAVSSYGTWVEVEVVSGSLLVEERGLFDRVELGTRRGGEWRRMNAGTVDAVRFGELYLAPHEEVAGAAVRMPSPGSEVRVRWQVLLSTGETVTGQVVGAG